MTCHARLMQQDDVQSGLKNPVVEVVKNEITPPITAKIEYL